MVIAKFVKNNHNILITIKNRHCLLDNDNLPLNSDTRKKKLSYYYHFGKVTMYNISRHVTSCS